MFASCRCCRAAADLLHSGVHYLTYLHDLAAALVVNFLCGIAIREWHDKSVSVCVCVSGSSTCCPTPAQLYSMEVRANPVLAREVRLKNSLLVLMHISKRHLVSK